MRSALPRSPRRTTAIAAGNHACPFSLRAEALQEARARLRAQDPSLQAAYAALLEDADKALVAPLISVTQKSTLLPPTNDKHDYFSLSPYWWPDPSKPDGLPYIRRDGETNPESKRDLDQPRVAAMGANVHVLALAWYFSGKDEYAQRAAQQLRAWFLDPATRMNPHLRFAQLVRGNPNERGSGIIDTRWFIEAVEAACMLNDSRAWHPGNQGALQDWFRAYLTWLRTSPNGAHEFAARNNHGSWFAAQTAAYALFIGDTAQARELIEDTKRRIGQQINAKGEMAEELARTRSLHYHGFNIEALSRVAEMGRRLGIDLWNYQAPEGGSLRAALDLLAPYVGEPRSKWPGPQIDDVDVSLQIIHLRRANYAYGDRRYASALQRLPANLIRADRSALLYPDPAATQPAARSSATSVHPSIFITKAEAAEVRTAAERYPLLQRSLADAQRIIADAMARPIDVPQPGEAGGYAHEKHKQNYREMQLAGLLYQITDDARYARYVRDVLEGYAKLYPTLGAHPLNKNQSAGKLFHQALNEANWLVAVSIAYDCVFDALTPAERARFEANVLRPMASWLSEEHPGEFDRIHNHGTWATAAVGMLGYVLGDTSYVNRALYGTKRDRSGGFIRQLDLLFSPDGYYMEGPYYIRYALMPFFYLAEAIERKQPTLGIYRYRDAILRKGLYSAVATAFPNGVFPPINDASRTMSIESPEVVLAVDLAYQRFGANANLLGAAAIQDRVILNGAGVAVARDLAASRTQPALDFGSIEFTDGFDGKRGGLGILRTGSGAATSMLLMKYGVHGQGHGHYDKLHFVFFDGGREVVPDYGFSRWINIEPKYGGRYLPENDSYAMQTVAHNTVVVDQRTQNDFKEDAAEAVWGERHFFDSSNPNVQVMSARANKHYNGVAMQRTMLLIRDARLNHPAVVDLYRLSSAATHTYDYPIHHRGQLILSNVKYQPDTLKREPLGAAFGYQHIWREASGSTAEPLQLTWLDGNRYYTITTAGAPQTDVLFGRTGANDPNFNLTSEPLLLLRRRGADHLFASVIEPHGYFSEAQERSEQGAAARAECARYRPRRRRQCHRGGCAGRFALDNHGEQPRRVGDRAAQRDVWRPDLSVDGQLRGSRRTTAEDITRDEDRFERQDRARDGWRS